MKRLTDLNIGIIKAKNKEGNDKIKEIHYRLNELIYDYNFKYVTTTIQSKLYEEFIKAGMELKEIDNPKAKPKAEEIQAILRTYCKTLKTYMSDNDKSQIQAAINYFVREYINDKDNIKGNIDKAVEYLYKAKRTAEDYLDPNNVMGLNLTKFDEAIKEILREVNNTITTHYNISF